MFKTGIWHAGQWPRRGRMRRAVSYRLLDVRSPSPAGLQIFEYIVRDLELSSGVCRTTYRGRLKDVDAAVSPLLAERFGGASSPVEVQDWAASDCLASSEWAASLFDLLPRCRFTASDLSLHLLEVSRGEETYVFEPGGAALQYIRPPFVIDLRRTQSPLFIVNRMLKQRGLRGSEAARRIALQCHWEGIGDARVWELPPWRAARLPLIHPHALALAGERPDFAIATHSAFSPLPAPCQVIRTMNIFNRVYFTEHELRNGARSVFESLVTGGIWIVGRTTEETVQPRNLVTVCEKTVRGFVPVRTLNGGSGLEDVVRGAGLWEEGSSGAAC